MKNLKASASVTDIDQAYGLEVLSEPAFDEPVSVAEAKAQLAIDPDDSSEDARIESLIKSARKFAERWTRRRITPCVLRLTLRKMPSEEIFLPGGVVRAIDAVTYRSVALTWTALSSSIYEEMLSFTPPRLVLGPLQQWPSIGTAPTVLRVDYQAGWADVASVPDELRHAMLLLIGHWYERRGDDARDDIPKGAERILNSWQIPEYS